MFLGRTWPAAGRGWLSSERTRRARPHPLILGAVIGLVAAILRPPLASVGPVLPDVRADLAPSGTEVAVMAGLGVFCLGLPGAPLGGVNSPCRVMWSSSRSWFST